MLRVKKVSESKIETFLSCRRWVWQGLDRGMPFFEGGGGEGGLLKFFLGQLAAVKNICCSCNLRGQLMEARDCPSFNGYLIYLCR